MKRNLLFRVHAAAGLISGLFILLMSLSGAVLVFHADIDAAQEPKVTDWPPGNTSIDRGYEAIRHQYPHAQISNVALPETNSRPISFFIYDSSYKHGRSAMQVFLHPQTAAILKTQGSSDKFGSWLSRFHNSFHLGKTGEWLLGFFALVFVLSLITGIILFRKKIAGVLLFRRSVYNRNNLHQVIGVYALLFNLVIGITGFWMQRYVFKKEFYQSYDYTPVLKASPPLSFSFDSAYNEIKKRFPDFTAHVIYFAQSPTGKTNVYGSRASNAYIHSKKFADAIMLDSAGGIAKTRMIGEISADDRYDIINSQLHIGKYGGWGIKIIYFVFGLSGALLSITGFLLWWRRRSFTQRSQRG